MQRRLAVPFAIAAAMVSLFPSFACAQGTSARTWLGSQGNNNNVCGQTEPCSNVDAALAVTTPHGEINCVDSGDFVHGVITKSVTIDCHNVLGGIDSTLTNANAGGLVINFDAFDPSDTHPQVIIRGVTIQGYDNARFDAGAIGILITGAGAGSFVNIENVMITGNYLVNNAGTGTGISDQRSHGLLHVNNTIIQNNAVAGISIGTSNGSRRAVIRNTQVLNSGTGIHVGGNSEVTISHSEISDNATAGLAVSAATGSVTIDSTTIAHNGFAFQNSGTVRLSNSDVMYNATGWTGTINTFTNNRFSSNGTFGTITPIGSTSNPTGQQ